MIDMTQPIALLTILGAILSMMYVVGSNKKLQRLTGWRLFFVAHHVAIIALGFATLFTERDYLDAIAGIWAVTMFALTIWHWKLMQE